MFCKILHSIISSSLPLHTHLHGSAVLMLHWQQLFSLSLVWNVHAAVTLENKKQVSKTDGLLSELCSKFLMNLDSHRFYRLPGVCGGISFTNQYVCG